MEMVDEIRLANDDHLISNQSELCKGCANANILTGDELFSDHFVQIHHSSHSCHTDYVLMHCEN